MGGFVAFVANIGKCFRERTTAIYLWDAQTGIEHAGERKPVNNSSPANGICDSPVISSNGRVRRLCQHRRQFSHQYALTGDCHVYSRDTASRRHTID
jgi:hypothetical protein